MKKLKSVLKFVLVVFAISFATESFAQVKVGAAIRLYRPKYKCNHKMSLCIGKKRSFEEGEEFLQEDGKREPVAYISLIKDNTEMEIEFKQSFDKSDGIILVIDEGYNIFEMDEDLKKELGVSEVFIETGEYAIDLESTKFGSVILPVKVK